MTEDKIFLVKCKREEIINRPTIKFVELTKRELKIIKEDLKYDDMAKSIIKKLEEIGDK